MNVFLNWSGGKDSAFCLYKAKQQELNVKKLVTSVNEEQDRISMHGVRRALLEQQAVALGLPLETISLPLQPDMKIYEERISESNQQLKKDGLSVAVFGDIFLEDLRQYRENLYSKDAVECLFPLWKMDSRELVREFIKAGFRAIIVCVNASLLDPRFCGRMIDEDLIRELPSTVDPCGENGEYHSFVFDGPLFKKPVTFRKGAIVQRDYPSGDSSVPFYFCDLLQG